MDRTLELKLRDCLTEAGKHGSPDALLVLHLLLGNYQVGTQREFARHCAKFASLSCQATISEGPAPTAQDQTEAPQLSTTTADWLTDCKSGYIN